MIKQQKKLEPEQTKHLFNTLEQRFQQHTERHMQISWAFVREQLCSLLKNYMRYNKWK